MQLLQVVSQPVTGVDHAHLAVIHQGLSVAIGLGDEFLVQQAVVVQAVQIGQGLLHVLLNAAPNQLAVFLHPEFGVGLVTGEQAAGRVIQALVDQHAVGGVVAAQLGFLELDHDVLQIVHGLGGFQIQGLHPVLAQPDVGEGVGIGDVAGDAVALAVVHGHFVQHAAVGVLDFLIPSGEILIHNILDGHDQIGFRQLHQVVLIGDDEHIGDLAGGDGQTELIHIAVVRVVLQPLILDLDVQGLFSRLHVAVVLEGLAPPLVPGRHVGFQSGVVVVNDRYFHRLVVGSYQRALAIVFFVELLKVIGQQLNLLVEVILLVFVHGERGGGQQAQAQRHSQHQGKDLFHTSSSF